MSEPDYKGRALLPMPVIEAARAGDAGAVEQVLRYYEGYINKLCTRTLYGLSLSRYSAGPEAGEHGKGKVFRLPCRAGCRQSTATMA